MNFESLRASLISLLFPRCTIFVLPGGTAPRRGHATDAGLDLFVRNVCGTDFADELLPRRRTSLWDFNTLACAAPETRESFNPENIIEVEAGVFAYRLPRNESLPLGLGIAVDIPAGFSAYVQARSLTVRDPVRAHSRLEIANDSVPIDPNFHGEIWAELVNHGPEPFVLRQGMRLCQLVTPLLRARIVTNGAIRRTTGLRHAKAHGSTGLY